MQKHQPISKGGRRYICRCAKLSGRKYEDLVYFYDWFYKLYEPLYKHTIEQSTLKMMNTFAFQDFSWSKFTFREEITRYLFASALQVDKILHRDEEKSEQIPGV